MGKISIGGKEFFGSAEFPLDADTPTSDQPGSDSSFVTDMGVAPLLIRVRGDCTEETDSLSDVRKEIMTVGELSLILDTGWEYRVFRRSFRPVRIAGAKQTGLNGYHNKFEAVFVCEEPYQFTTTDNTRSKAITANNETWTADDSGNALSTDGEVDAVPDIQVTGGTTHAGITQTTTDKVYNANNSGAPVTIDHSTGVYWLSYDNMGQTVDCRGAGMGIIDSVSVHIDTTSNGTVRCDLYDKLLGSIIATKTITVTTAGVECTFTFDTPVAVGDFDPTCVTEQVYFEFTRVGAGALSFILEAPSSYSGGQAYRSNGTIGINGDMDFTVNGHSVKEIRQTFTVDETYTLSHVVLNLCKYNYAGSNPATVTIKEGGTTLGSGTASLSGSTFTDFNFYLDEQTAHSLELAISTTYTIIFTPPSDSGNATAILIKTNSTSVYANGAVTLVEDGDTTRVQTHDIYFKLYFSHSNEDVQIYNTADSTVKCDVANQILEGSIHRINTDGTGTIDFDDDITTQKYATTCEGMKSITYDDGNDEFDIADDGYIYWKCDSKYSVTGIPTLTSQINITAGTPTIQISTDAANWYDIDTAIVDDVDTEYELDDSTNLSLKGQTSFYFRFDCVKAGAATCSIKSFELDVDIVTIDAENPVITEGGSASTFRCDQDSDSGMNCEISIIYPDRRWPG